MYEVYSFLSFFLSIIFSSFFFWGGGGGGGGGYFIVTVLSSFFCFNLLCSKLILYIMFISCTLIFVYR